MWAVVEFLKKACCVVPYSWVTANDTLCYWPSKNVTAKNVEKWVVQAKDPSSTWPKFDIVKLHYLAETCDAAEEHIDKILEEAVSTDNQTDDTSVLRRKVHESSDEEEEEETPEKEIIKRLPKGKRVLHRKNQDSSKKQKLHQPQDGSSSDEFSDDIYIPKSNKLSNLPSTLVQPLCGSGSTGSNTPTNITTPSVSFESQSTSGIANQLAANTPNHGLPLGLPSTLGELLLRKIEQVIATQDQHAIVLDNISRNQASLNIAQLERPDNMPNLPIANKHEYKALETFLKEELPFAYLKKRLAALGGVTVRNTVMGMLKFLLKNEVAMKFNWAGRDKRPFKHTNMLKVVKEAVRYSYRGRDDQDLTDKVIEDAVKDWLKLAKARHSYGANQ